MDFYITTPIYYVNDEPHLGHAYTTILADVLARYARLQGSQTFFLTGVDEHGQKAQEAARLHGLEPQAYVDLMHTRFQSAWQELEVANDDFIRTTQPRHVHVVEHVLNQLWQQGDIYLDEYQGWYCVPDERFWTEKDLRDGQCPDCGRPVEPVSEPNYFFRMNRYQGWLIDYIQAHLDFILPALRRNEVLGFLHQPLGDLCISRPASRLNWGIPLPFDPNFVTYVWFDALLNYVTAAGYLQDEARFSRLWPQARHLIGKDILTTHSVYWPTMLKAAGLPMPRTIFATGWWTVDGEKISKSRGNTVKPLELASIYGVEAFRYYLMSQMQPGHDADFSRERLASCYQADLANNLGNLLQRVVNMLTRYCDGRIPSPAMEAVADSDTRSLIRLCEDLPGRVFSAANAFDTPQALDQCRAVLDAANQYLERQAPWKRSAGNPQGVNTCLYTAAEALRLVALLLSPVMPKRCAEVWRRLGWLPLAVLRDGLAWGMLQPGAPVTPGEPLFPRK